MNFTIHKSIEILERTPFVLNILLSNLSSDWTSCDEGPDTWSAYDVIGHLIHGEKTDWIPRIEIILSDNPNKSFESFDRFAQFNDSKGKEMHQLLKDFQQIRHDNIRILNAQQISDTQLNAIGIHPKFGPVTLRQLISTWAVHDLNHISQITRVIAKHYTADVGPWQEYLRILKS